MMNMARHGRRHPGALRCLCPVAALLVTGALLAACDNNTPVGESPALQGTYLEHAIVTNPNGGGPMVERYGPPVNWNPSARD